MLQWLCLAQSAIFLVSPNIVIDFAAIYSSLMLPSATLSPRKTANFVLKLKARPAHRSPQKTHLHPQPVQNMGRSVSCSSYAVSAPQTSPRRGR
jgi:hypothetical protein